MMQNTIFLLLILIPVAGFITERYLNYLNGKMWSVNLPPQLKGICSDDEYIKTRLYEKANRKLSFFSSVFNLLIILSMIIFGGFSVLDNLAHKFSSDQVAVALIFFGMIGLGSDLLNIPFNTYDTFVIERNFGFNTMKVRTFITDHIKSWLLVILIGAPVLGLITWFYYLHPSTFWIYAWILVTAFTVFINFFYSELIVPLFNKQVPLEEGSLREKIQAFAEKAGFKIRNIYKIDGSKRSTKANAYFSGFGPKKRIVLYDTLISEMTEDEIVAVLAHEIGHYRKKHIILSIALSVLTTGLMLWLFSLVAGNKAFALALGSERYGFHLALVVFGILYTPVSMIIGLATNYLSRKNEFAADRFAKEYFDGEILAGALKKLSVKNLSNMIPHPAYVFFHYSHPPLLQRLERLN